MPYFIVYSTHKNCVIGVDQVLCSLSGFVLDALRVSHRDVHRSICVGLSWKKEAGHCTTNETYQDAAGFAFTFDWLFFNRNLWFSHECERPDILMWKPSAHMPWWRLPDSLWPLYFFQLRLFDDRWYGEVCACTSVSMIDMDPGFASRNGQQMSIPISNVGFPRALRFPDSQWFVNDTELPSGNLT